jgi:hypothetical protein
VLGVSADERVSGEGGKGGGALKTYEMVIVSGCEVCFFAAGGLVDPMTC